MAQTAANRKSHDPVKAPGKEYAGYLVCDPKGRKIGRTEELYTNVRGEPEYITVRLGLFGLRSVLIPVGFVSVDEGRRTLTLQ